MALLALFIVERLAYVFTYLGEVPFATAPVSDGELYVRAAYDILDNPPLGNDAFWLQGAYAYLFALAMRMHGGMLLVLPLQLATCALAYWLFLRCLSHGLDRTTGLLATTLLLASPQVGFYETKHLTAALTVAFVAAAIGAHLALLRSPRMVLALAGGAFVGLAWLMRPNLVLAAPPMLLATILVAWPRTSLAAATSSLEETSESGVAPAAGKARVGSKRLAVSLGLAWVVGFSGVVTPLALRNLVVIGIPTVMPIHGGGTSFWIGNNPDSTGLWNDAGGILSGDVTHEGDDLGGNLVLDDVVNDTLEARRAAARLARARTISRDLYARSFDAIADDPAWWARLELRKLSLTFSDEVFSSDYDFRGERELIPWAHRFALPFSALTALSLLGIRVVARRPRREAWIFALVLGAPFAATLLANLAFFTSAQHRLPLVVPMAVLAAYGVQRLLALWPTLRDPEFASERIRVALVLGLGALVVMHGAMHRLREQRPSSVHYYNLSLAYRGVSDVRRALVAIEAAVARDPDQPLYRVEYAAALGWMHEFDRAIAELDLVLARDDLPGWVRKDATQARDSLILARAEAAEKQRRTNSP